MTHGRRRYGLLAVTRGIGLNLIVPPGGDLSLAEALGRLRAAGADFAEVAPHRLGVLLGGRLVPERTTAVRAVLLASGLGATVHAADRLNLMDPERSALGREILASTLRFAAVVGAPTVVYHAGQRSNARDARHSLRAQLATERRALWELGELAGELGVTIAVENSYPEPAILSGAAYAYGAWPSQLADQVAGVDHPAVRICLDLGHAWIAAGFFGFPYVEECAAAAPLVRHVHLHDNLGRPDLRGEPEPAELWTQGVGDLHLPPGKGNAPLAEAYVAARLDRVPTCCVELCASSAHLAPHAVEAARRLASPAVLSPA